MKNMYEDIISLPHPEPRHHTRMPLADRAAQFAPFAALRGYHEKIGETAEEVRAAAAVRYEPAGEDGWEM